MKRLRLYPNLVTIHILDIVLLAVSMWIAYALRFDFRIPAPFLDNAVKIFPLVLATKLIVFHFFDLYRGMWRFTSIADMLNVIKAASVSSLIIISGVLFITRFAGFPRSAFVLDWLLTIFMIAGLRIFVRLFFERVPNGKKPFTVVDALKSFWSHQSSGAKKLLIIGAGNSGEKLYREIRDNADLGYRVVGFIDDSPIKVSMKIHGVQVFGPLDDIGKVVERTKAEELLIAVPSASSPEMRRIVHLCKDSKLPFKTIPGYGELIDGRVTVNAIREVAYKDLLGREVIHLEEKKISAYIANAKVLVTGAGGSIGSELCRQLCRFHPKRLVLFERAESPLYDIELELKQQYPDIEIKPVLGDINDVALLQNSFETYRPTTLFHAAAYKHVPMLERQPWRAVENNIIGTMNVVETAKAFHIDRFVFVSTDKAVRPANIMGASKRISEMLVQCHNHKHLNASTRFMIVRFGNVVGSVGSVVPLFKKQIERGGPVTVTHPEVTRFFMTIPEACQLILQAGAMGKGGEIFILDMGTPIKIADMARDLIRLSGFEPDVDIGIDYIGLRPGEKLYEELITEGEGVLPTPHEKILVLEGNNCNLTDLERDIHRLAQLARVHDGGGIREALMEMLPEYQPAVMAGGQTPMHANPPESVALPNALQSRS
jgi:FlaA1/EpsC-like NDP-sugar epimerase